MRINVNNIDIIKAKKGLTNADIAQKANLTRPWLSTIFKRGEAEPITVHKLAQGLGVDVTEIIEMEG